MTCANCGRSIPEGTGVAGNLFGSITGIAMEGDTVYCSNRCKDEANKRGGGSGKARIAKKVGSFLLNGLRGI
jgi:predicted nucleic acid-binding Zn ribbon protein